MKIQPGNQGNFRTSYKVQNKESKIKVLLQELIGIAFVPFRMKVHQENKESLTKF